MPQARALDRLVTLRHAATVAPDGPVVTAGLLGVLATAQVVVQAQGSSADGVDASLTTSVLLCLGATLPVALARVQPLWAASAVTAATSLTLASGRQITVAGAVTQLVVLYLVARRRSLVAGLVLLLPFLVYAFAQLAAHGSEDACRPVNDTGAARLLLCPDQPDDLPARLPALLLLTSVGAATALGRGRRLRQDSADRTASSQVVAHTLMEHAARGERARIARELHDVVAHHISMIAVQAETARLTTPGMPADGAKRLVAIGDTARDALTEMRRLLGVLREDAAPEPDRRPQPGIPQLIDLVDEARASAGAGARLIVHGHVATLDPGVELTAYRIVQEALTNSRRHAPGAAVDVRIDFSPSELRVRVRDNGPGPPSVSAAGHGLLGMRERAAMVGGSLWTGPAPANGFVVEAVLPIASPVR